MSYRRPKSHPGSSASSGLQLFTAIFITCACVITAVVIVFLFINSPPTVSEAEAQGGASSEIATPQIEPESDLSSLQSSDIAQPTVSNAPSVSTESESAPPVATVVTTAETTYAETTAEVTTGQKRPLVIDSTAAIPESEPVGDEYFTDAIFLGNSRTEGLRLYSGLKGIRTLSETGLTVSTFFTKAYIETSGGAITAAKALESEEFSKVYLMFGINELGWNTDTFIERYGEVIEHVRSVNPDTLIYIQSVLPVSSEKSASSSVINNENIRALNERIRQLASDYSAYYLDVASGLADDNGCMPEGSTWDGVHLNRSSNVEWLDYLRSHTVNPYT